MFFKSTLRASLASAVFLLSPGLPSYVCAAQVVAIPAQAADVSSVRGNIPVRPVSGLYASGMSLMPASLAAPSLAAPAPALALSVRPAAVVAHAALPETLAAGEVAQRPVAAAAAPTAMAALLKGAPAQAASFRPEPVEVSAARMAALMDGATIRRSGDLASVWTVGAQSSLAAPLERPALAAVASKPDLPFPARSSAKSSVLTRRLLLAAVVVALMLVAPSLALAATPAIVATGSAATLLGSIHPTASVLAAAAGAVYGAIAARGRDGSAASSGEVLGSVLRYGVLAGAGVYACMDISQSLFLGVRSAVSPLPTALATAALGQSAFQGKFADPATSSADRIMSVFPAAATALGLNLGVSLLRGAPALLTSLGVGAMTLTGVASLLVAVTYDPAKSPAGAPAHMARGFVLQALMTGLALALSSHYLIALCAVLAAWGFAEVLYAAGGTVTKFLQGLAQRLKKPQQPKG